MLRKDAFRWLRVAGIALVCASAGCSRRCVAPEFELRLAGVTYLEAPEEEVPGAGLWTGQAWLLWNSNVGYSDAETDRITVGLLLGDESLLLVPPDEVP